MITKLTAEQEALIPAYVEEGIKIGLAVETEFNTNLVRELTDKHRVSQGLAKATNFIVYRSPFEAQANIEGLTAGNALYGQHDINWLQYYMYYREVCGLTVETEPLIHLYELAKHAGWMWMSSDTTVVTWRPVELHMKTLVDGLQVLHNFDDLALKYADGTGVYACNGRRIPKNLSWIITTPADQLDPQAVLGIQNTELRTEAIKKIGVEKMFDRLDPTMIHTQKYNPGGSYELFSIQFEGEDTDRKYLRGYCPSSKKIFIEAVPPQITTVGRALNWRERGPDSDVYNPPLART